MVCLLSCIDVRHVKLVAVNFSRLQHRELPSFHCHGECATPNGSEPPGGRFHDLLRMALTQSCEFPHMEYVLARPGTSRRGAQVSPSSHKKGCRPWPCQGIQLASG